MVGVVMRTCFKTRGGWGNSNFVSKHGRGAGLLSSGDLRPDGSGPRQFGEHLVRVHPEILDGLGDEFAGDLAFLGHREECADGGAFSVDLEEPPQIVACFAAPEAVCSQGEQAAGDPR